MKLTRKIKLTVAAAVAAAGGLLASAQFALAQQSRQFDAEQVAGIPIISGITLRELISNIVNFALIFTGIIAVIYLIYGGLTYITAGGDAEKAGKGRTAITNAIIGIIIILASYLIYSTVILASGGAGQGPDPSLVY